MDLSLAKDFKYSFGVLDLKYSGDESYILYAVDKLTKFTPRCFIENKNKDIIIDSVTQIWLGSGLGSPKRLLTYNGGEFENEIFRGKRLKVLICINYILPDKALENGVCELNQAIVGP